MNYKKSYLIRTILEILGSDYKTLNKINYAI